MTIVYTKNDCMKCDMTKRRLTAEGIPFEAINIEDEVDNPKSTADYISYLKDELGFSVMPVVVPSIGEPWGDFRIDRIRQLKEALNG